MAYGETKVYFDGSHYIAIPHTTRPSRKRRKPIEETITVFDDVNEPELEDSTPSELEDVLIPVEDLEAQNSDENKPKTNKEMIDNEKPKIGRQMTKKELFEEVYQATQFMRKKQRINRLFEALRPHFDTDEKTKNYVNANMERKQRNLICRRTSVFLI